MAQTKTDKEHQKKQSDNELGISKNVYAAGNAVKQGFIATAALFVGIFAFLQYGDKVPGLGRLVAPVSKGVRHLHETRYGLVPLYKMMTGREMKPDEGIGPVITVSLAAATLLSHFFQIAGIRSGRGAASAAIDKYNATVAECEQTKQENQQLRQELAQMQGAGPQASSADNIDSEWRDANKPGGWVEQQRQQPEGFGQAVEQSRQQEPAVASRH